MKKSGRGLNLVMEKDVVVEASACPGVPTPRFVVPPSLMTPSLVPFVIPNFIPSL